LRLETQSLKYPTAEFRHVVTEEKTNLII